MCIRDRLKQNNILSGYIFRNRFGDRISARGIAQQLKYFAIKYGLNKKFIYPHSFRHRFAKNFLEKFNDIASVSYTHLDVYKRQP